MIKTAITEALYRNNPDKVASMLNTNKVYNVDELSIVFGKHKLTINRYRAEGKIVKPIGKVGRYWLWSQEQVDQMLQSEHFKNTLIV